MEDKRFHGGDLDFNMVTTEPVVSAHPRPGIRTSDSPKPPTIMADPQKWYCKKCREVIWIAAGVVGSLDNIYYCTPCLGAYWKEKGGM